MTKISEDLPRNTEDSADSLWEIHRDLHVRDIGEGYHLSPRKGTLPFLHTLPSRTTA